MVARETLETGSWDSARVLRFCTCNNIDLDSAQAGRLVRYVQLLLRWNNVHNLISRRDAENIWERHILHCLAPLKYFHLSGKVKILDIGTGGGLPGIPLAILCPEVEVTLVDSIRKKTEAVSTMTEELALTNVRVLNCRVEDRSFAGRFPHWFDLCIARAVAPLTDLLMWSAPVMRHQVASTQTSATPSDGKRHIPTPCLLALKGGDLTKEYAVARKRIRNIDIDEQIIEFDELDMTGKKIVVARLGGT
jgi:16S rRNA (guanine527-N7)-methyltransferase